MNHIQISAIILASFLALSAKTPQQVKASLDSIAPPDTFIKIAYLKGGTAANFARETRGASVYVVSSEDGIIRKVNTVTGNLIMVNITADGKRVLFYERNSSRTYIVDWDGKNERIVASTGMLIEYWRDRNQGTDWAIMENNGQYRINVDNPSSRVTLSPYGAGQLSGGLSDDGSRILVHNDGWGTAAVGSTSIQKGSGGCQASMRAGPLAQWSCNESGHMNSFVNNPNGTVAFKIVMGTDRTGEGARFTQHPNYFTFMQGKYEPGPGVAYCEPRNPILLRISDMKRIAIEDSLARDQFCGDVDAVFLPKSTAIKHDSHSRKRFRNPDAVIEFFSIDGRRMSSDSMKQPARAGVVINRNDGLISFILNSAVGVDARP